MFNPVLTRIEDILNAPAQFAIPVYQRDYRWGKEEALDLIEDLKNYQEASDERLFLGNFIFETANNAKTFVVDGQQRLTTILLLLIACRMRASQIGMHNLAQTIQTKITFIDATTAEALGCRLIASESIRDVFEYIARNTWDGIFPIVIDKRPVKRQSNKLRPIYEYFFSEVSELDKDGMSKFLRAIYNSFVIRIDIKSDIAALSIFERTNARGMELEISDLLKNYLFAKKVDGIEEAWSQIVDNSNGTILRMLKYFYVAKSGYVLKPNLYKNIKKYAVENGANTLTEELVEFSKFYQTARIAQEATTRQFFEERAFKEIFQHQHRYQRINHAIQALHQFGVVQYCPPAYAAIENITRNMNHTNTQDAKSLMRLFETFEKYHFINNAICERVGNEVEKLYADICDTIFSSETNLTKAVDHLVSELKKRLASEDEFVANFIELTYSQNQLSLLAYIFDRINNYGLDPSQYKNIYNPDPKILRKNHNIEHFLPQNPGADLKVSKDTFELIDNIGNLLAISYKTNSKLGNASPANKMELLQGKLAKEIENLAYVNDFIDKYKKDASNWDKDIILKRAKDMALDGYRRIWKIQ